MQTLLRKREFWTVIVDTVVSLAVFFVGKYAGAAVDDLKFIIGVLQAPVSLLIVAFTVDSAAQTQAAATVEVARMARFEPPSE